MVRHGVGPRARLFSFARRRTPHAIIGPRSSRSIARRSRPPLSSR